MWPRAVRKSESVSLRNFFLQVLVGKDPSQKRYFLSIRIRKNLVLVLLKIRNTNLKQNF